jgi:hypothetical protein
MFKTYDVAGSLWQMNLFVTLQLYRSLTPLSYATAARFDDDEAEDATDRHPAALKHQEAA